MLFAEYLSSKKIDSVSFSAAEPALFQLLNQEFDQMHPHSFTQQKLFLINPIRRKYPLQVPKTESTAPAVAGKPKPVMRPKPKMS